MAAVPGLLEPLVREARELTSTILSAAMKRSPPGRIAVMEVCGTHTVVAFRSGLRDLLPGEVRLISGPGCPVCVTVQGYIDAAVELALSGVVVATFGDMVRVPGSRTSLEGARAEGGEVRVVYSVRQALELARSMPGREVVFLGVGFETTAPGTAWAIDRAHREGISNFSVLSAHKLIIPAMEALLTSGEVGIDGFLCPGHVSVIIGWESYRPLVENYRVPCAVAGFDGYQMLKGMVAILRALAGRGEELVNVYTGAVTPGGNGAARALIERVFEPIDTAWRGLGCIPRSGLAIRGTYAHLDAERRLGVTIPEVPEPTGCRCGEVIKGLIEPVECPLFRTRCTPAEPVGPCMVSREGSCRAWFRHGPV